MREHHQAVGTTYANACSWTWNLFASFPLSLYGADSLLHLFSLHCSVKGMETGHIPLPGNSPDVGESPVGEELAELAPASAFGSGGVSAV